MTISDILPFSDRRTPVLTDGGLETDLIFNEGIDLPEFAAFPLLDSAGGRRALARYYHRYADIAAELGTPLVLESPTWRASANWADALGYTEAELDDVNRRAISFLRSIADEIGHRGVSSVISGCLGPMGDGSLPDAA